MRGLFVTGTDTDAGKTLVCSALMAGAPPDWHYWKPVQTGLAQDPGDTATLAKFTQNLAPPLVNLQLPASPHFAARMENQQITLQHLLHAAKHLDPQHFWLLEGAGGALVPLNDRELLIEIPLHLHVPVLIVVRVRLGAINHALLTERALVQMGLRVLGFVLSGPQDPSLESALVAHVRVPILGRLPEVPPGENLQPHGEILREALQAVLP